MAITKSAKKAHKQSLKKRVFNLRRTRAMKEKMKEFEKMVRTGSKTEAQKMLPDVYQAIDKAAKRGVIKFNNASRKKASMAKMVAGE